VAVRLVLVIAVLALLAAGCGARSDTPFTAKGTLGCLKAKQFTNATTAPSQVGFNAGFAANGGITATSPNGNVGTIAFTDSDATVPSTEKAFKLHAPASLRSHIGDVMRSVRNVVIVWTTTPAPDDETKVEGCLAP
jgi:hypothetical protein